MVFVMSEDTDFSSEGARSGRNWEDYFDYLRLQFHIAHNKHPLEFQKIMRMCYEIVFRPYEKGKGKARDSDFDSGESEINWELHQLEKEDETDGSEWDSDAIDANLVDGDNHANPTHTQPHASPSTPAVLLQSSPSTPATPQRAPEALGLSLRPYTSPSPASLPLLQFLRLPEKPALVPKKPTKTSKPVLRTVPSSSSPNLLFPLPPTPKKSGGPSTIGVASDSDPENKASSFKLLPPKKRLPSRSKQIPYIEVADEEPTTQAPKDTRVAVQSFSSPLTDIELEDADNEDNGGDDDDGMDEEEIGKLLSR